MSIWTLCIVLFTLAIVGGGLGYARWGYPAMYPAGFILIVTVAWLFTELRV